MGGRLSAEVNKTIPLLKSKSDFRADCSSWKRPTPASAAARRSRWSSPGPAGSSRRQLAGRSPPPTPDGESASDDGQVKGEADRPRFDPAAGRLPPSPIRIRPVQAGPLVATGSTRTRRHCELAINSSEISSEISSEFLPKLARRLIREVGRQHHFERAE